MVRSIGYVLSAVMLFSAGVVQAEKPQPPAANEIQYEVTITNLTRAQSFTPQLVVTHDASVGLYEAGQPASLPLEILAEGGATGPLTEVLSSLGPLVDEIQTIDGLVLPGQSVTTTISASGKNRSLSFAAMLIPTNDTFVALDRAALPRSGSSSYMVAAYDAGTEANDQNCSNIPGPRCGGEGHSPGPNVGDEGFVHVSNGFHLLPEAEGEVLSPITYDWRNPVARVVVQRLR